MNKLGGTVTRCTRCVMDDSADTTIIFDRNGYCNYCTEALVVGARTQLPPEQGAQRLEAMLAACKATGGEYDCAIGLSGGLDSSYLALRATKDWGLKVLALHVDDGLDTQTSSANISKLAEHCGIDVVHLRPNSAQYFDLLRAHMLAGVPNIAAPQDNVLFAALRKEMLQRGVRTFLSGGNFALECILQRGNTHDAMDGRNIRDIGRRFGRIPHDQLPILDQRTRRLDHLTHRISMPRPLNYVEYTLDKARRELEDACGFEYYGAKHHENHFTRFLQTYWMPEKFGVDKRTSHLSSLVITQQITRDEALKRLNQPRYREDELHEDLTVIAEALDLKIETIRAMTLVPGIQHSAYSTSRYPAMESRLLAALRPIARMSQRVRNG